MKSNDVPITRAEEEQFYGKEVTEHDIHCAVRDQLQALDADDCAEVASEFGRDICFFAQIGDATSIGDLMIRGLRALAQRRAHRVLGLKVKA
jgi:hypothetical protein